MRVHESVALGARLGNPEDFAAIVRSYEGPLFGYVASELGREEAEDAVQEIFLKAFTGIRKLREADRMEAWLYSIARNEIRGRRRGSLRLAQRVELDLEELASEGDYTGAAADGSAASGAALRALLTQLPPEQAAALRLRHWAGLSVREIALVENIAASTAKSRLWEATRRLRGIAAEWRIEEMTPGFEEQVMERIEEYRNAGEVFERLGLDAQVELALAAQSGNRWSETLLAALGRVRGGSEFVRSFDARLRMRELAQIVNCCDHFTEKRLVEELERVDLQTAEAIKAQMFVFEDVSLFDEAATRLLFSEVDGEVLALCLAGIERRVRETILGRLEPADRSRMERAIRASDPEPSRVRAAQEAAVAWAYQADKAGRLRQLDRSTLPEKAPFFTVAPGKG